MSATDLATITAEIEAELAVVASSVPSASGRSISTKGKVFTLPDGSTHPGPMQAVILDWRNRNTYYKGAYNPNQRELPPCFAISKSVEGMVPSPNATEPQHTDCATCPQNQFKSAAVGNGKACKNQVQIAILSPDATDKDAPMLLTASPTAIKSWTTFVNDLKAKNLLPIHVVAEIKFDSDSPYPTLQFKSLQAHDRLAFFWGKRALVADMLEREPSVS